MYAEILWHPIYVLQQATYSKVRVGYVQVDVQLVLGISYQCTYCRSKMQKIEAPIPECRREN